MVHTKCFSRVTKKTGNQFHQGGLLIIIFLVIIAGIAPKNGAILSRFSPCPSLLSVSTESRKQFQRVKSEAYNPEASKFPLSV